MDFSESIRTHKRFLEVHIDPDFRLLDKLYSCEIIDQREKATISSKSTFWERNSQVIDYILTKNQSSGLITALRDADQKHIANFITANGERSCEFGEDWPLETAEISILKYNHESLVDLLDLNDLLSLLYASDVINSRQRDSISSKPTSYEKNGALLEILQRRSLRDYRQTITCLRLSQQNHIAKLLEKGGVVVRAHANLGDDVTNVTAIENEIVTTIADMLIDRSIDQGRLSSILGLVPKVIAAKTGQSIVLYIYCKTIDELHQLQESLDSGKLQDSVDLWFNSLLNRSQRISVKALRVSTVDIKKMQTYFKETDQKSSEATHIDSIASARSIIGCSRTTLPTPTRWIHQQPSRPLPSTIIYSLPLKLLDDILEKSYLHWVLNFPKDQRDGNVIRALASVDFCWFQRITKRRFKKRIWKRLKVQLDNRLKKRLSEYLMGNQSTAHLVLRLRGG